MEPSHVKLVRPSSDVALINTKNINVIMGGKTATQAWISLFLADYVVIKGVFWLECL